MYPKYKKLLKFNYNTTNQLKNPLTCGQTSQQKTFTYGKQTYKVCSTPFVTTEIQVKIKMRYHYRIITTTKI